MKAPLSWLKEYVEIEISVEELCEKLQSSGFEVESITPVWGKLCGVVVGKILDVKPHFQADNLSVCMVDSGKDILHIVTAAKNVNAGDFVPVAVVGSTLFDGTQINECDFRGIHSYGMMLSGQELGIDNSVCENAEENGILLLQNSGLEYDFVCGEDIAEVLGLNDYILDVSITSNRPDCASIFGLAREISSLLGKKLRLPNLKYQACETDLPVSVEILNQNSCPRYMACAVHSVKVAQSPLEIRKKLWLMGHKPINNIVDITNYVLMEMGQPMHAFDYTKINGAQIIVRDATENEKIVALNDKEYALNPQMLAIADKTSPIAIAGVMGGGESAISEQTESIVFEAAKFARATVRSTARKLGLHSDSSARFEKGVDISSVPDGMARALHLIYKFKLGKICPTIVDIMPQELSEKQIVCEISQINDLLGISLKQADILRVLRSLRFDCEINKSVLTATVPLFREDVEDFADLTEEIIRCLGYENIVAAPLCSCDSFSVIKGADFIQNAKINQIRQVMVGQGANETCTYSLVNKKYYEKMRLNKIQALDAIALQNPINEDCAVLRTHLLHNLLECVALNNSRKNHNLFLFEVGKTYQNVAQDELCNEITTLCAVQSGKNADFYKLKSICDYICSSFGASAEYKKQELPFLHNGICAQIDINGKSAGYIGKIHPLTAQNYDLSEDVVALELSIEPLLALNERQIAYSSIARFPVSQRDLAVVVDGECAVGDLLKVIYANGGEFLKNAEVFDIYKGAQIAQDKKSVAFSLVFYCLERTLKEEEVMLAMKNILNSLEIGFGAKLRA